MQQAASKFADAIIAHGIATTEDRDIYVYGFELLITTGGFVLLALASGIILGYVIETF